MAVGIQPGGGQQDRSPGLVLLTNSYDTTADLLIHRLGAGKVFRFNFDLCSDYAVEIVPGHFRLADPTGREISEDSVVKALWRKPWSRVQFRPTSRTDEERYYDQELWYAIRDIVNLLWRAHKLVLVEPFAERRAGKFVQLRVAARHLQVPGYQFRLGLPSAFADDAAVVVKSLTTEPVGPAAQRHLLFTTRVDDRALSPDCPWMVQDYIHADRDVTVAFVRDQLFAFELDRTVFRDELADWREMPTDWEGGRWFPHVLPAPLQDAIFAFMAELDLQFGRLDFLCGQGGYFFLEVNTNGEWAWLDTEGRYGLLDKVAAEIDPGSTPVHSIPVPGIGAPS